ncbi:MAG: response regulator transcription factor [Chloroflexia bacterium]
MEQVLLVEDDPVQADAIAYALEREGYQVIQAGTGLEALRQAKAQPIDLVILDLGLPGLDGFEVCRWLRQTSSVPILVLTARDAEEDLLRAFSLGADDYLTKPFRYREMLARLRALLRRSKGLGALDTGQHRVGRLWIDLEAHQATLDGQLLPLTPAEFRMLARLVQERGHVLSCRTLLRDALGYDASEAEAREIVRVHIWRLRNKMGCTPADPEYIHNVRGIGYMIHSPLPQAQ